jgi:phosphoglucomutase
MSHGTEGRVADAIKKLNAAKDAGQIAESTQQNVQRWLTDRAYAAYCEQVLEHVEGAKFKELDDVFWTVLPFGTGGRRGKMYPIGTNVMNERTVSESAQGLATYLRQVHGASADLSCVIAHDTRINSEAFARLSARILAANDVRVFLFRGHRSTPQLSFAVRDLKASAGIVISASHNPPSDNGFKCYWSTGAQVLEPHDAGIIRCVESVRDLRDREFEDSVAQGMIVWLEAKHDEAYIDAVAGEALGQNRGLRIVYSPLHGVGMTSVFRALQKTGFGDIRIVESQSIPDGNFPNVANHAPNPENPAVLREAMELAEEQQADLVLASDPDADRIAAAVPDSKTKRWVPLSGNQVAGLLAYYVVSHAKPAPSGQSNFVVKTLVTTDLVSRVAEAHHARSIGDLPVGFKWIARAVDENGPPQFLFGAEESLGYLVGTYARDKDAAVAGMLMAELAADLKASGKTVLELLDDLYRRHGLHVETAVSKSRPGRAGASEIGNIMRGFRTNAPPTMGGMRVARVHDFVTAEIRDRNTGKTSPLQGIKQQQVMLEFDRPGWRLVARPSGTEPKIKFYLFGVVPPDRLTSRDALGQAKQEAEATMKLLATDLDQFSDQAAMGS